MILEVVPETVAEQGFILDCDGELQPVDTAADEAHEAAEALQRHRAEMAMDMFPSDAESEEESKEEEVETFDDATITRMRQMGSDGSQGGDSDAESYGKEEPEPAPFGHDGFLFLVWGYGLN